MNTSFLDAIQSAGLVPPDHIRPERWERFPGQGKKHGNKAGYCFLFADCKGGVFGDFSTGFEATWQDGDTKQDIDFTRQMKAAKKRYKKERDMLHNHAVLEAQQRWSKALPVIAHPYLQKKKVKPASIRQEGNSLIIPVYINGKITSLQSITPDGKKYFSKGGEIFGGYFPIGKIDEKLYICEGFATGSSLYTAAQQAVAVAFNAGNIKPVAILLRKKYPALEIIIAADDDEVGLRKGREAAKAINAVLIYPRFDNEPFDGSDFNDYLSQGGEM
jgi:putative DNA primase/helicase